MEVQLTGQVFVLRDDLKKDYEREGKPNQYQLEAKMSGDIIRLQFEGEVPERELFDTRESGLNVTNIPQSLPAQYVVACESTGFSAIGKNVYDGFEFYAISPTRLQNPPFTGNVFRSDKSYQLEAILNEHGEISRANILTRLMPDDEESGFPDKELFYKQHEGLFLEYIIETFPQTYLIKSKTTDFVDGFKDVNGKFVPYKS